MVWSKTEAGKKFRLQNLSPVFEMLHFNIKVQGGEFSVYVDGLKESSFFNTEFTQGKLYLAIAENTLIDNFMVRPYRLAHLPKSTKIVMPIGIWLGSRGLFSLKQMSKD